MKLAQALIERGDLQKRIDQISYRLQQNAKVQEGEKPAENPQLLLSELNACVAQLESLITKINLTNAVATENGESLTAMLARRETMGLKVSALRDFLSSASSIVMRGTKAEIVVKSTVSVEKLQVEVDELSKQLRLLDIRIQELNWLTEIS